MALNLSGNMVSPALAAHAGTTTSPVIGVGGGFDYDFLEGQALVYEGVEDRGLEVKASERIDAYIKSFLTSAEHPNKEEQILYKQQILEELQVREIYKLFLFQHI